MSIPYRKTLIASMVLALAGAPSWVGAAGQSGTSGKSTQQQMSGQSSGQLSSMTPNELEGKKVVTTAGQEVGTVKSIVSDRTQDKPHAVISAGGFLGVGDKEIVVSLDKLKMSGDQLQVGIPEQELRTSPQYMRDQYVEVTPDDQPISEFSAFETQQPGGTTGGAKSRDPGRVHESPSGKELPRSDPRQSSDISPDRKEVEQLRQ